MHGINEVAKMLNTNPNTLRYYERAGILPAIQRDKNGVRQYSDHNVEQAHLLLILRNMGMSLKDAKEVIPSGGKSAPAAEQRAFQTRLYALMDQLDNQIKAINTEKELVQKKIDAVTAALAADKKSTHA